MTNQILRLPAVIAKVGLSRSSLYAAIAGGYFPKSIPLGARAVGWLEADIEAWIVQRAETGRKSA